MLRAIILAASAVTTGASLGRKALDTAIDRRVNALIEESAAEARAQIRLQSSEFFGRLARRMAKNAALRLGFLALLWGLRASAVLPADLFIIAAAAGLGVFLATDIYRSWPTVRLLWAELRRHGWRPRRAVSEAIAAHVFDDVMSRAADYPLGRTHRLLLSVAGRSPGSLATEVAGAVADVARSTSWGDMRPYLLLAGINIGTFWCFYIAASWLLMTAA